MENQSPPIRLYLDTSLYNRPFDDQSQPRIWLETLAFSVILQMIADSQVALVTSSVVAYENSRNPDPIRQDWVNRVAALAIETRLVTPPIRERAQWLEQAGVKGLDALHLACAEAAAVDYFVTVDDRLIRRYRRLKRGQQQFEISNPTEFARVIGESK
jgi:predicted nucleic acid-binding protein